MNSHEVSANCIPSIK